MKKIVACVISIISCSMMAVTAYAANKVTTLPGEKDIDVRGIYVSKFDDVSVGRINGGSEQVEDKKVNAVSETETDHARYAVNKIKEDDKAFSYVKETSGFKSFDAFYVNFIDDENGKHPSKVTISLTDYSSLKEKNILFIDGEGNKQKITAKIENGVLSFDVDESGFIVIETEASVPDDSSFEGDVKPTNPSGTSNAPSGNTNTGNTGSENGNTTNPTDGTSTDNPSPSPAPSSNDTSTNNAGGSNEGDGAGNNTDSSVNTSSSDGTESDLPKTGVTGGLSAGALLIGAVLTLLGRNKKE